MVLLIDRWYAGVGKPGSLHAEDAQERRRKVVTAIEQIRFVSFVLPHNIECRCLMLQFRRMGETNERFDQAAQVLEALLDRSDNRRPRAKKRIPRRGLDLQDVLHFTNAAPGRPPLRLPRFVKSWIEQPNYADTPHPPHPPTNPADGDPASNARVFVPTVFTAGPSNAVLVDPNSQDAIFWSKIFDMEFWEDGEPFEMWFMGSSPDDVTQDAMEEDPQPQEDTEMAALGSLWGTSSSSNAAADSGANPIWAAISGPIGSMERGDDWVRASPSTHAATLE